MIDFVIAGVFLVLLLWVGYFALGVVLGILGLVVAGLAALFGGGNDRGGR